MKRFFKIIGLVTALSLTAQTTILRPDKLQIGKGSDDKTIVFDKGSGSANPKIKWDNSGGHLQFSDDGTSFTNFGTSIAIGSTKTSNYTTTVNDKIIYLDGTSGAFNLTLHTPTFNQELILERIDNTIANPISIVGTVTHKDNTDYTNLKFYTISEQYHLQYNTLLSKWKVLRHTATTTWIDNSESIVDYYTFVISVGSATIGATYTNNGNTYTVARTEASNTQIRLIGTAAPTASGTLTKATGTGDATLTFSSVSGNPYRISATTTAPIYYGNPITNQMLWKRNGSFITVRNRLYQAVGGASGGSGDYIFPTPRNITIDTTRNPIFTGGNIQAQNSQTASIVDKYRQGISGRFANEGAAQFTATEWAPYTSTSYRIFGQYNNGDGDFPIGSTYMPATAIQTFVWEVTFQVSGWME